eukprot:TRINITY_DN67287_c5_g1_i1.p1 TRINITY_DN67287_c5_g1~~TRINITY_DN67287_c5_g1_i1.p1  ORF type:complete len:166 (+),score=9.62 TRINITY_DN67287_c5_g1_i1:73-570(+)
MSTPPRLSCAEHFTSLLGYPLLPNSTLFLCWTVFFCLWLTTVSAAGAPPVGVKRTATTKKYPQCPDDVALDRCLQNNKTGGFVWCVLHAKDNLGKYCKCHNHYVHCFLETKNDACREFGKAECKKMVEDYDCHAEHSCSGAVGSAMRLLWNTLLLAPTVILLFIM